MTVGVAYLLQHSAADWQIPYSVPVQRLGVGWNLKSELLFRQLPRLAAIHELISIELHCELGLWSKTI